MSEEEEVLGLDRAQLPGQLWEVVPMAENKNMVLLIKRSFSWLGFLGSSDFACNNSSKMHETSLALGRKQL